MNRVANPRCAYIGCAIACASWFASNLPNHRQPKRFECELRGIRGALVTAMRAEPEAAGENV